MSAQATFTWQANLLDASLTARSARRIAAPLLPAITAGLMLAGIVGFTQSLHAGLADLRSRAEIAERRVQDSERKLAAGSGNSVEARRQAAEALEAELASRRTLFSSLQSSLAADNSAWTLSGVLTTLSQQHRDGVWLTRIAVDRLRRDVLIEGRAYDAQQVSNYVAGLGKGTSVLANLSVRQVESERDESVSSDPAKTQAPQPLKFKLLSQTGRP